MDGWMCVYVLNALACVFVSVARCCPSLHISSLNVLWHAFLHFLVDIFSFCCMGMLRIREVERGKGKKEEEKRKTNLGIYSGEIAMFSSQETTEERRMKRRMIDHAVTSHQRMSYAKEINQYRKS